MGPPGRQGERGERGERGEKGEPGPMGQKGDQVRINYLLAFTSMLEKNGEKKSIKMYLIPHYMK